MKGNIKLGKFIEVHILLPVLCIVSGAGGYFILFSLSWLFALLHELAHIAAGRMLKIEISGIALQPFGVCAKLKNPVVQSPVKEIVMTVAGPGMSLFLGVIFTEINRFYPLEIINYCAILNFSLFFINLLPCLPLDGGRILRAVITLGSNAITSWRIMLKISRIVATIILAVSIILLLTYRFNFSFLMIGVFLLGNLTSEQRGVSVHALREILYHRDKLNREELNGTYTVTAYADLPARRLLRELSYHKYYIIKVVDDEQRIIKTLTENQVLNALLNKGIRIKLGEI